MFVIGEPGYAETNWCHRIVTHLKERARKKRITLSFTANASDALGDACAFVLGGSAAWIGQTVKELAEGGTHPILLSELPDERALPGRYSFVKTDYRRYMRLLAARFAAMGLSRVAFYGANPASLADAARRDAFLSTFPEGEIFENLGSLAACYAAFSERHGSLPFGAVICTNDLAAVSLLHHMEKGREGERIPFVTVHSATQLLSYFPDVYAVSVDHTSLAAAAFEIADCITAHRDFIGMRITVDYSTEEGGTEENAALAAAPLPHCADPIYEDAELDELMRIETLLSVCDETDLEILRLIANGANDIGESTFLSDNGVKYRIKKMKRICRVESKAEIPRLLEKYNVHIL